MAVSYGVTFPVMVALLVISFSAYMKVNKPSDEINYALICSVVLMKPMNVSGCVNFEFNTFAKC